MSRRAVELIREAAQQGPLAVTDAPPEVASYLEAKAEQREPVRCSVRGEGVRLSGHHGRRLWVVYVYQGGRS